MMCVGDLGCDGGRVHSSVQVDMVLCVNVRVYVIAGSNVDQLEFLSIDMYDLPIIREPFLRFCLE